MSADVTQRVLTDDGELKDLNILTTCGKAFQTLTCMALDSLALHGQGAVGSVHMACHVRFVMPCHAMMSHSCGTTQRLKFWNQCFLHLWKDSYCT